MKTITNYLISMFLLVFLGFGCKSGPEKDATVLQFPGFNTELNFAEDNMNASFTNRYFFYYLDKEGNMKIDYVSEPDFIALNGAHPLERNIGQNPLTTLLHADRIKDKIMDASINYTPSWSCKNEHTVQVYGLDAIFKDKKGKKTMDLIKPLDLKQLIKDMYSLSAQDQDPENNCKDLAKFKADAKASGLKIQLKITAKLITKSGKESVRNVTFIFRGIPEPPVE